ncbi:hypothetical protein LJB42_001995 [Komagataella kurtzmanii]|nr:hypothetical protein LJB42_001995 [Komagataella kurtzmanii]
MQVNKRHTQAPDHGLKKFKKSPGKLNQGPGGFDPEKNSREQSHSHSDIAIDSALLEQDKDNKGSQNHLSDIRQQVDAATAAAAAAAASVDASASQHAPTASNLLAYQQIFRQHHDGSPSNNHPGSPTQQHSVTSGGPIANNATASSSAASSGSGYSVKPATGSEEWHKMRKENHKEVERRRRENINHGIKELAALLPTGDSNKAQILKKAVDYIKRLKENENNNIEKWTLEKLITDQAVNELANSNEKLKAELEKAYREIEHWKKVAADNDKSRQ